MADLKQIAAEMNVSYQMVQKIEKRALAKCLAWCQRNGIELADLIQDDNQFVDLSTPFGYDERSDKPKR